MTTSFLSRLHTALPAHQEGEPHGAGNPDVRGGVPDAPVVPGYRLTSLRAVGATTEVWHVVRAGGPDTGPLVALVRAHTPEAERRARLLHGLDHPGLLGVHEVTRTQDGRLAVLAERHETSLAQVLEERAQHGPLTAPELAGLVDGLGHALGRWHELGQVHGDVCAKNVLVDAQGRVLLVDLLEDPRDLPGPQGAGADLEALRALLTSCVGEGHPARGALLRALARAAVPGSDEPAARDLAAAAAMIAAPAPLEARRLHTAPAATSRRELRPAPTPHVRRGRRARVISMFVALGLLLGVAGGIGLHLARGGAASLALPFGFATGTEGAATMREQEAPTEQESLGEQDVALAALLARRDEALRDLDEGALARLTVPGSAAAEQDRRTLQVLRDAGERPVTLSTTVEVLAWEVDEGEQGESGHVQVRAQVRQEESIRETPQGQRTVPAQPARCVLLDMQGWGEPEGLRLRDVVACDAAG